MTKDPAQVITDNKTLCLNVYGCARVALDTGDVAVVPTWLLYRSIRFQPDFALPWRLIPAMLIAIPQTKSVERIPP